MEKVTTLQALGHQRLSAEFAEMRRRIEEADKAAEAALLASLKAREA